MKSVYGLVLFIFSLLHFPTAGQLISPTLPQKIEQSEKYLFYLHGGVVTVLGNNAINQSMPEWGPYEYLNILDSLRSRGFNIISENRKEGIDDSVYVNKILNQIDTLFKSGVKPENILVVGASAGSVITINVSARLKNREMKYVVWEAAGPTPIKTISILSCTGIFFPLLNQAIPWYLFQDI